MLLFAGLGIGILAKAGIDYYNEAAYINYTVKIKIEKKSF
jgi:hypothetical protein